MLQTKDKSEKQNIEIQNQILQVVVDQIQEEWRQREEKLRKESENYLSEYEKIIKSFTVTFQCALSKQICKIPVYLYCCVEKNGTILNHFDTYFDLYTLLSDLYKKGQPLDRRLTFQCPECDRKVENAYIGQIILPHYFVSDLQIKYFPTFPKSVNYFSVSKIVVPIYPTKVWQDFFHQNCDFIIQVFRNQSSPLASFRNLAFHKKEYRSLSIFFVCLLTKQKITIPVRGKECLHYEAYDLLGLLKSFGADTEKVCVFPDCWSKFSKSDPSSFQLDSDLFELSLKSLSFSLEFNYNPGTRQLTETLSLLNDDLYINSYRLVLNREERIQYTQNIYQITERIFVSQQNAEQTKIFHQGKDSQFYSKLKFEPCKFTNCLVMIPARCIKCTQIDVCDLRFYACVIDQKRNQNYPEVKKKLTQCPLCNQDFKGPNFAASVYVDTKILHYIQSTHLTQRNSENFVQFMINQAVEKPKANKKKFDIAKGQHPRIPSMDVVMIELACIKTKQKLKTPVRIKGCQHYTAYEYTALEALYNQNQLDPSTEECPVCKIKMKSLDNLYIDELLTEIFAINASQIQNAQKVAVAPKNRQVY